MMIRTFLLALVLLVSLVLFGLAFLGAKAADETRQVPINVQEASRIVLSEFPNARILEMELDDEDGRLVYEVELVTAEGQKKELHINAFNGQIEKIERD